MNGSGPKFRKGGEALKEAQSSGYARTTFFGIEDGEEDVLRFLTDYTDLGDGNALITVQQHNSVPTKPEPDGWEGKWPAQMSAVCRHDVAFRGIYDDCFICDHMSWKDKDGKAHPYKGTNRGWALACRRQEVQENGRVVGYKVATRTVTRKDGDTEKEVEEKAIVLVNQGYKNFFQALVGYGSMYGTILDRDYKIKRDGKGLATTYTIVPMDAILLQDGTIFDLRDPELMKRYSNDVDLEDIVANMASDEYYEKFFDTRVTWTPQQDADGAAVDGAPDVERPSKDVSPEQLEALAARIKGMSGGGEPKQNGAAEEPKQESKNMSKEEAEAPKEQSAAPVQGQTQAGSGMRNFD